MTFQAALKENLGTHFLPLHYESRGEGLPLILLHGFAQNSYSFRHIIPKLAENYRVIAIDLKGFGQSPKPRGKGYSIYHQALSVYARIDKLKLDKFVIAGHSFGGGVALALTLLLQERAPGQQMGLIHIGGMCYRQIPPLGIELLQKPLIPALAYPILSWKAMVRWGMQAAYLNPAALTEDAVEQYAKPLRTHAGKQAVIQAAREIEPPDADDFMNRYVSIHVPTQIIWGDRDRLVPPSFAGRLSKEISGAKVNVLQNCGHCPHEEKPDETIKIIQDFLKPLDA